MTGHMLTTGQSPARKAASGATKNKYSAGDILWIKDKLTLDYAIVLEPDVDRTKALDMVFTQMVALGDAIGAIAPPEVGITYHWPNHILANGAKVGTVSVILSDDDDADGCPNFMIIATEIAVRPRQEDINPGLDQSRTTLWDEGCAELDALQVLDSAARHFMTWIHTWEEDGFQPILVNLDQRMEKNHEITIGEKTGTYLGLDEQANLLLKTDSGTDVIAVSDALETNIKAHVT